MGNMNSCLILCNINNNNIINHNISSSNR